MSSCKSKHFKMRYEEIRRTVNLPNSKPNVMLYSTMAMIWMEIVLDKCMDWRTVTGRNVGHLSRTEANIPTNWDGASDCMPEWSNRGKGGLPEVPMRDGEDEWTDDDDDDDTRAPVTFGERDRRQDAREDIQYEQDMQEALRRSVEESRPQYGRHRSNEYDHSARGSQHGHEGSSHSSHGERRPHDGGERSTHAYDP